MKRVANVLNQNLETFGIGDGAEKIDPGFAPGTGTPEPGGFTPREVLEMVCMVAKEGL